MGCCECCRQRSLTYCLIGGHLVDQEKIPINGVPAEAALGTLEPILHVQFMNEHQAAAASGVAKAKPRPPASTPIMSCAVMVSAGGKATVRC